MAHPHDHTPPADPGPAFRRAVEPNVSHVIVEAAAGFLTGALALLAAAAHDLTDVAGLLIALTAWGLLRASMRLGLNGVPQRIDRQALAGWIGDQPGVSNWSRRPANALEPASQVDDNPPFPKGSFNDVLVRT